MTERLADVHRKIKRAEAHLHEIEEGIDAFVGGGFTSTRLEDDPQTGERVFVLHELRRPDPCLGLLIGDFLNNLRSALDHLAFQLVKNPAVPVPGPRTPDRQIQFPICDDTEKFKSFSWRFRGLMPDAGTEIEALQPYPDRSSPIVLYPSRLGRLRDLNDWDKHRLLHIVENELSSVGFLNPDRLLSVWTRDPGRLEAPAELARYEVRPSLDPEVDVGFYITSNVTFEGGPADGWGVKVSRVIDRLAPFVAP